MPHKLILKTILEPTFITGSILIIGGQIAQYFQYTDTIIELITKFGAMIGTLAGGALLVCRLYKETRAKKK